MNTLDLLGHLPTSTWIGLVISIVIPALSALLVKANWDASITGILTVGLSTATGFFTEWAHAGDGFRWQSALGLALVSWVVAALSQSKILSGTQLEASLLAFGSRLDLEQYDVDDADELSDPTIGVDDDEGDASAVTPAPEPPASSIPPAAPPAAVSEQPAEQPQPLPAN